MKERTIIISELDLTRLITELCDWVGERNPNLFLCDGHNLRAAFERYVYFESFANPFVLRALMRDSREWRIVSDDHHLNEHYDLLWKQSFSLKAKFFYFLTLWTRLLRDYSLPLLQFQKKANRHKESKVGFFTVSKRFIDFSRPFLSGLDSHNIVYFCPASLSTKEKKLSKIVVLEPLLFIFKLSKTSGFPLNNLLTPVFMRLSLFYRQIHKTLEHKKPEILLFAEGTSHYDYLAALAAKSLSIPTLRIQSGRAGVLHSGYRNMNYDTMLCWSEDFVERYRQVSPLPEYKVVGSPTIDEFVQMKQMTPHDSQKILFITQPVSQHITESDYQLLISVARELLASSQEFSLVVRQHPVDKHEGFDKLAAIFPGRVKKMNSPLFSLAMTLAESKCAIGFFSTAISEAAACGVIPIILQTRSSQSVYPFPEKHNAAIVSSDVEKTTQEVLNIFRNPHDYEAMSMAMQKFSRRFFGPADGKALHRTVSEVERLASKAGEQNIG